MLRHFRGANFDRIRRTAGWVASCIGTGRGGHPGLSVSQSTKATNPLIFHWPVFHYTFSLDGTIRRFQSYKINSVCIRMSFSNRSGASLSGIAVRSELIGPLSFRRSRGLFTARNFGTNLLFHQFRAPLLLVEIPVLDRMSASKEPVERSRRLRGAWGRRPRFHRFEIRLTGVPPNRSDFAGLIDRSVRDAVFSIQIAVVGEVDHRQR